MTTTGEPEPATVTPPARTTRGKLNRYTAVSIVAALANVAIYSTLLQITALHPTVANVTAAMTVALPTFLVNRQWSWNVTRSYSVGREVLPYYLFTAANVTISTIVAWFLAEAGASNPVLVSATVGVYTTTWVLRFFFLDRILFAARH